MCKIIKDCIYGHINIPPICLIAIDTPEFQRLRRIRQLGMTHYVYPSASHTRFEHCIGVMHLTGKMVSHLRQFVDIDERTCHLLQLAGLYHDIGHFAYSHLFDTILASSTIINSNVDEIFHLTEHEERSCYFLEQVNNRCHLMTNDELNFVKDVIRGNCPPDCEKKYLYEIISNDIFDVDRGDYLRRDAYHTGLPAFQSDYIILSSTIIDNHIVFNKKAQHEIMDMFETRKRMFINVYQHKVVVKVNKLYYCMMKRLGVKLFMFGKYTDDYCIETLIRTTPEFSDILYNLDTRALNHSCQYCSNYTIHNIDSSRFDINSIPFLLH